MRVVAVVAAVVVSSAGAARAQEDPEEGFEPGALPALMAVVPGAVVRGAGHWTGGDPLTARRLLLVEGVGFAAMVGGGAAIYATGASRRIIFPLYSMALVGFGLFVQSWLADIYGAATGGREVTPAETSPDLELATGLRWVHDPHFDHGPFGAVQARFLAGPVRLEPSFLAALSDDNQRLRLDAAVRLFEQQEGVRTRSMGRGTALELVSASTFHRYGSSDFSVLTFELALAGRLHLADLSATMRGAFAELALGAGFELYDYDVQGLTLGTDASALLLMRIAFGFYLGRRGGREGELRVYYDHRHDGLVGGLGTRGAGAGVVGHIGTDFHFWLSDHIGLAAELAVGSAVLGGADLLVRWGRP